MVKYNQQIQIFAVSNDFQQIFVSNKIETREGRTLSLEVLSKSFLDLSEHLGKFLQCSLDLLECKHFQDERMLAHLLHKICELGVDASESLAFLWEQLINISTTRENTLQTLC